MSDSHCGHRAGLTPPPWWYPISSDNEYYSKWGTIQRTTWKWFDSEVKKLGPIDHLCFLGDAVEGKGKRSGGTELITSDMNVQCEMAEYVLERIGAKKIRMIRGTAYHTGEEDDLEDMIAKEAGAKIGDHTWLDIKGLVFDLKHAVGSSTIPHGRATAIKKSHLWNVLWSCQKLQPGADILMRGHVHYHEFASGVIPGTLIMTLPAMQGFGSKYGARQCEGLVQVGFVSFNIKNKKDYSWRSHLLDLQTVSAQAEKL